MKFYRNLAIVLVLIAAALIYLKLAGPQPTPPPVKTATPDTPQAPGFPTQAQPASPLIPTPAATPRPTLGPTPVPTQAYANKIAELAQRTGVQIQSYSETGGRVNVVIHWIGDSTGPGGDFLDEGVKEGLIRNFKENGFRRYHDRQLRTHHEAAYELYVY
jgi:hypothetical protein